LKFVKKKESEAAIERRSARELHQGQRNNTIERIQSCHALTIS
jgi:hypothetical protein